MNIHFFNKNSSITSTWCVCVTTTQDPLASSRSMFLYHDSLVSMGWHSAVFHAVLTATNSRIKCWCLRAGYGHTEDFVLPVSPEYWGSVCLRPVHHAWKHSTGMKKTRGEHFCLIHISFIPQIRLHTAARILLFFELVSTVNFVNISWHKH